MSALAITPADDVRRDLVDRMRRKYGRDDRTMRLEPYVECDAAIDIVCDVVLDELTTCDQRPPVRLVGGRFSACRMEWV